MLIKNIWLSIPLNFCRVGANCLLFGLLCLVEHRLDVLAGRAGLHSHWSLARAWMALGARAKVPDCCRHGGGGESCGERAFPSQDQRPGSWGHGDGADLRSHRGQARARGEWNINVPWVEEEPAEIATGTVYHRYMSF